MAVRVECVGCQTVYRVDDSLLGKSVRCKKCQESIAVRRAGEKTASKPSAIAGKPPKPKAAKSPRVINDEDDHFDDDDDDGPRRRRGKKTKPKSSSILLAAGIGGGIAVIVGLLIAVILLSRDRNAPDAVVMVQDNPPPVDKGNPIHANPGQGAVKPAVAVPGQAAAPPALAPAAPNVEPVPQPPAPPRRPGLRYNFAPGQRYLYDVTIQLDAGLMRETMEGKISYEVKSSTDREMKLVHSGALAGKQTMRDGGPLPKAAPGQYPYANRAPQVSSNPGIVTVGPRGELLFSERLTMLPYLLGDFELLPIEELPPEGEAMWSRSQKLNMVSNSRPTGRPPYAKPQPTTTGPAKAGTEELSYKLQDRNGDIQRIQKTHRLSTEEQIAGKPRMEMVGDGEFAFHLVDGVTQSYRMNYVLRVNSSGKEASANLSVAYRLLSNEESKQHFDAIAAKEAARKHELSERPFDPGEKEKLLKGLFDPNQFTRRDACVKLGLRQVDGDQESIAKKLVNILSSDVPYVKSGAAIGLQRWATETSVAGMIPQLKEPDLETRRHLATALGRFKRADVAQALADALPQGDARDHTIKALLAVGSIAEKPVLAHVNAKELRLRLDVCEILAKIGTQQSIAPLENVMREGEAWHRAEAGKALAEIKSRVQ